MIELSGAKLIFYCDGQRVADVDVPVRLESFGRVTLLVERQSLPGAHVTHYQIALPMPVMFGNAETVVMLSSVLLPILKGANDVG